MQIKIQLSDDQARKLAYIQQHTQQDILDLIDQAIEEQYQTLQTESEPQPKLSEATFKSALDIFEESGFIGCIDSGESNISENHRAIVSDIIRRKFERSREP